MDEKQQQQHLQRQKAPHNPEITLRLFFYPFFFLVFNKNGTFGMQVVDIHQTHMKQMRIWGIGMWLGTEMKKAKNMNWKKKTLTQYAMFICMCVCVYVWQSERTKEVEKREW